jgi:hypothetical protein
MSEPRDLVHKAKPLRDYRGRMKAHCVVCGQWIKRVPGGQGPTWVHSDSGAVAGPNPPAVKIEWWMDHRNLALTARFMMSQTASIEDVLYMLEKPWKHDDDYNLAEVELSLPENQ